MNLLATLNKVVEERLMTQAAARRQSAPPAPRLRSVDRDTASPRAATDGDMQDTVTQLPTRRPRVLVVDDSPTVRRQLAVAMHRMGLDSEGVSSAREGLDTLARRRLRTGVRGRRDARDGRLSADPGDQAQQVNCARCRW
jgi:PleD family two-component response regulator